MAAVFVPVVLFVGIVLLLSAAVLGVRAWLFPAGTVRLSINDRRELTADTGRKLLGALAEAGIYLPAACGGRGACGECRVRVLAGSRPLLPNEAAHIDRREAGEGFRLACMFRLLEDTSIVVPPQILAVRRFDCRVVSNRHLTPFLKELVLALPGGAQLEFEAGDYVLLEAPPHELCFRDFDLDERYRGDWDRLSLLGLQSRLEVPTQRAYSLGNPPQESGHAMLIVRIALPPPQAPTGTPPGRVSSYIFGLGAGDAVSISGPFGGFHASNTDREMVLIAGGAGIAPIRSIVFDQLAKGSQRKMSLWYGCRDQHDLCYRSEFEAAAQAHPHFDYHVALSEPRRGEPWEGHTGFIHAVAYEQYLKQHPAPEDAEYYLCGPPVMSAAVVAMLEDLGVEQSSIFFDDFGS